MQGYRNTGFFHRVSKIINVSKQLSILRQGDTILEDTADLETHVTGYFGNLYASNNSCTDNGIVERVIPSLVTDEDNKMLTDLPSMDEVKEAVFSMDGNSVAGPDGFGGCILKAFWDIVGIDVFKVLQFFEQNWIMPNMNSNVVVLIPKTPSAYRIEQYMRISLANLQFKIITNILADRLAIIAQKLFQINKGLC